MRKTPIIVTIVLISLASVYALVTNLLPDTTIFPRIPMGNGTIGGSIASILGVGDLANYGADGTANNTAMLSGITSTGYLRSSGSCGATKVWTSLGAGTPTCADKNGILASMGSVNTLSGTVTAYHADGTFETLTSGTGILEGDIIKTNPGTTVTIAFADLSILRVGEDSTVSLDVGMLGDQSLAYAILENGSLWGRVLSETGGYYIGRDDLIVGVRGTSVSFKQSNPSVSITQTSPSQPWQIHKIQAGGAGELSIIQSSTNSDIGTVSCIDMNGRHEFPIGTGSTLQFGSIITSCSPALITMNPSIANIYTNRDIAKNVIADLDYMSGVLTSSLALTQAQRTKINTEFSRSRPTTLEERSAICPATDTPKAFWDSLMRTNIDTCQERNVLAVADFRGIDIHSERNRIYFASGESISPTLASRYNPMTDGIEFLPTQQPVQFAKFELRDDQFDSIRGKNIQVFTYAIGANGRFAINLSVCSIKSNGVQWVIANGGTACRLNNFNPAGSGFTVSVLETPTTFIIGNKDGGESSKALGTKIQKIIITD